MRRRDAFVIAGAMAIALAIPPVLRRLPSKLAFEPLEGFEGFRRLTGGPVSGSASPFMGLDTRLPDQAPLDDAATFDPCLALFGADGWAHGLPIAIFSDFNCPYCLALEARLMALRDSGVPVRLVWHEMPLLGPASTRMAQAVLAARHIGSEEAARAFLKTHRLRPSPVGLEPLADHLNVSAVVLRRAYQSASVSDALATSLTLGARLGIPGTPGTVIGRTLVIGAIRDADLKALIALEQDMSPGMCT